MLHKVNGKSMLRTSLNGDERMIASLLFEVNSNVRAMCRAMQVYDQYGIGGALRDDTLDEMQAVFAAFYTFVDSQMDIITDLAETLESDFHWVSLGALRASDDFGKEQSGGVDAQ